MWPGKINEEAYEQYVQAWREHEGDGIRLEGPDGAPRVGYSMLLAIAPTEDEALGIARRGMEGLVRRTQNAHRFDPLVVSDEDCYAAQGPLRAIHANMELAIQFGAGTPGQIAERVAALLDDGMADYICFMFPTGDMNYDEAKRTLELFVTEVMPELEPSTARPN
jgi:alkanesulfonate monooxygenase SsuD/methylene tetrahydromethanopterin reductase-like flavin-dependent oxidoreductase (luciferase family)